MVPRLPVTGVSELVLEVEDLDAAEAFYAGLLGMPVVERWAAREAIWVMAGERTRIGLWRPQVGLAGGRGGAHVHFAMQIGEGDYDAVVRRLRTLGAPVTEHSFGPEHGRAAYLTDPDGHVVELWTWDVSGHLATMSSTPDRRTGMSDDETRPDDEQDEPPAPGSADTPPAVPEDDDDSALGDTDQHSGEPA
jgi:catechol 2,3-dioxygenase-like lactoylglutathione lyase family enzyme